jgi:hypothetical protein
VANRIRTCLPAIIHPCQHFGERGRYIFDAVATVSDVVVYAVVTKKPICEVSLDFSAAFDNISHAYMEEVLRAQSFCTWFTDSIMRLYVGASTEVQTNGFCSSLIPIHSSIRQGCPLSMLLFALCLNPSLHALDDGLRRIELGQDNTKVAVAAYADDPTVFLISPVDSQKLQEILSIY